ncbi:MAG: ubiquinol-cytochrome c reductase iron-sulfur subunit [Chloroflexota bacterium]|nr:MAG: ubiquinol-cytochrome c reductase iron-sulfur subunit [Chloroflexota bacterium]
MTETTASAGNLTRREFLYYIWGGSIALFIVEFTGLMVWFMLPRFREGEFGGTFTLPVDILPDVNAPPFNFPDGRFWLVNVNNDDPEGCERMWKAPGDEDIVGAAAIYKVCTHLGCIYAWVDANDRYECPCHGSKYRLDGRRIEDPAPRDLDRFKLSALDDSETVIAESSVSSDGTYETLQLPPDTVFLQIDTGDKKDGGSEALLADFPKNCP